MEYWIPDSPLTLLETKRRKGKEEQPSSIPGVQPTANGLVLSPGDALFSATLKQSEVPGSILEWDFVQKPRKTRIKTINKAYKLFPATQPATLARPSLNLRQRTEQAARFLRTRYPDIDVSYEVLEEQIQADEVLKKANLFDPYVGNQLAVLMTHDAKVEKRRGLLAFPTGVLGNELNISPIYWSRKGGSIFTPEPKPVFAFETPIQHIVGSTANYSGWHELHDLPGLAVRTHAAVSFMSVLPPNRKSLDPVVVKEVVRLTSTDLGGTPIDVALSPFSLSAGLLSTDSSVFYVDWKQGRDAAKVSIDDGQTSDGFKRLTWTRNESTALVAHSHVVRQLDLKAPNGTPSIIFVSPPTEVVSAIEGAGIFSGAVNDHIFCLTTTRRVIWMDHRYFKQPVLSWKHERSVDRTLEARTCWLAQDPLTFLTSRENGLVTIYSVAATHRTLHHIGNAPQILRTLPGFSKRRGCGFFRHPFSEVTDFAFLELSEGGAMYSTQVLVEDGPSLEGTAQGWNPEVGELSTVGAVAAARVRKGGLGREWSLSMEVLEDKKAMGSVKPVPVAWGERENVVVDLSEVYKDVIHTGVWSTAARGQQDIERIYQTLECMPQLWQGAEYPLETVLTTGDVALASGPEPSDAPRSDFLRGTILHSTRGYHAFKVGHFPTSADIAKDAAWSFDLRPSMEQITGLEIPSDPEALLRSLERYEAQGEAPTRGNIKEERLIEEVALDIALSMDVFSAIPLSTHPPRRKGLLDDDELERATQALSITDHRENGIGNAPPVVFSFLRPRCAIANTAGRGTERVTNGSGIVDLPLGVRQLLADWKLGEDPDQFTFRNPYEEHEPRSWKRGKYAIGQKPGWDELLEVEQVETQTRLQIPVIMASSQVPPTISTQRAVNSAHMPSPGTTFRADKGEFDYLHMRDGFGFGSTQIGSAPQPLDITSKGEPFGPTSQTWLGPSTQVLPGPHGGRPEANMAQKKPKKRAKGF